MKRFVRYALPPLVWAALIIVLSAQQGPSDLEMPVHADKVIHAGIYAILGALTARALRGFQVAPLKSARFALIACAVFGLGDELHQGTVAGRFADMIDWGADILGGAVGAWGFVIWEQRRARSTE